MNKYTCMSCGRVSVINSRLAEVKTKCNCTTSEVVYKLGEHKIAKPATVTNSVPETVAPPATTPENPLSKAPVVSNVSAPTVTTPTAPKA